jgi:hypothetical protein
LGERDAALTVSHPGRGHDNLLGVGALFAALCRLVLHAPLANLFPKGQGRKLPPASNTVRHEDQKEGPIKEYQQSPNFVREEGKWRRIRCISSEEIPRLWKGAVSQAAENSMTRP